VKILSIKILDKGFLMTYLYKNIIFLFIQLRKGYLLPTEPPMPGYKGFIPRINVTEKGLGARLVQGFL